MKGDVWREMNKKKKKTEEKMMMMMVLQGTPNNNQQEQTINQSEGKNPQPPFSQSALNPS